jgi:hypothetical protein
LLIHGSYTALSDVCPLVSLYLYCIPCMISRVNLVSRHRSSILHVCSGAMSVDAAGQGSTRGTRVSLISSGMGLGWLSVG